MKIDDLRAKTDDELMAELANHKKAQYNLRFQKAGGQLEKTAELRKTRRTVARISTVLSDRKRGVSAGVATTKGKTTKKTTQKTAAKAGAKATKKA